MYSPILTADLLQGIWLTYLLPLRHVRETIFPEKMVVISFLAILVIVYLFPSLKYLFYLWAGTFLFLLIQNWRMKKRANQLEILYSEISNEGYDGEEIAKRLYKLEDKGITFPSIVYPLLRLKHKPSSQGWAFEFSGQPRDGRHQPTGLGRGKGRQENTLVFSPYLKPLIAHEGMITKSSAGGPTRLQHCGPTSF